MIDVFNVLDNSNSQIYYATGNWQTWNKPSNCKFVSLFVLGGGAGGGGGQQGTATRRGGGGGGSAAYSYGIIPAPFVPDILYIQPGFGGDGGIGGASSTNGSAGSLSYVCTNPTQSGTFSIILKSGLAAPTGGLSGANLGTAGGAGTAFDGSGLAAFMMAGSTPGQAGGLGNQSANGADITITYITTGGAGGGGTNLNTTAYNGGSIIGTGSNYGVAGGLTASGLTGSSGFTTLNVNNLSFQKFSMFFNGGAGGAASLLATGGQGGDGSYGCGGGGGGAGATNLAGNGGQGGDGIVIITWW